MYRIMRIMPIVLVAGLCGWPRPSFGLDADSPAASGPELTNPTQNAWPRPAAQSDCGAGVSPAQDCDAGVSPAQDCDAGVSPANRSRDGRTTTNRSRDGRTTTAEHGEQSPWPAPQTAKAPRELSATEASPLKTADPDLNRSEQLELIARQADRKTLHGFELAGRGAYFAARAEFLGALKLIADGLDTEQKTDAHGRALATALTALKEAEDFLPDGSRTEAELDLPRIIAAHDTPVLKNETGKITAMTATRCYLTFAQEQFAAAAGREVAGSMALRALGKLYDDLAAKKSPSVAAAAPKAIVYYQAALLVFPENYMAANDLGVMLARSGNYLSARKMLEYSVSLSRQSTTWRNLAVVYRQLGQTALAARAEREEAACEQVDVARRRALSLAANAPVRWVDPQTLSQTSSGAPILPGAAPPPKDEGVRTADRSAAAGRTAERRPTAPTPAAAQREYWKSRTY